MKKNSISRIAVMIVTALLTFNAANTFAGNNWQPVKATFQLPPRDTPYLAMVQINRSGIADTPYISFSIQPALVYDEVNSLLSHQNGLFHVLITYVSKAGDVLSEEDYYIDNRYYLAVKTMEE